MEEEIIIIENEDLEEIVVLEDEEEKEVIITENDIEYIYPKTQEKTLIPKKEEQTIIPDKDFYALSKVTVEKIPDEYVIPNLQMKIVTPKKYNESIKADSGYDGLSQVIVEKIPDEYIIPTGTIDITENGEYDVTEYANVNVDVETGQVIQDIEWKDVVFIDFDGTPLYSYSMEEVQELTELPHLPIRKGFTYQGWNWTLEDIKAQIDGAIVGAHCVTSDGLSRFHLDVWDDAFTFIFGFCQDKANGFLIDWGDGTSDLSGTSTSKTTAVNKTHTYEKKGKYIITLYPQVNDVGLYFKGSTTLGSYIIKHPKYNSWISNSGWSNILKKIELGEHFKGIGTYGLNGCMALETINIPIGATIGTSSTRDCNALKSIVIPNGTTNLISNGLFYNASMESVSLPASYTTFGNYLCESCGNLKHIRCMNKANSFGTYCFRYCYNLKRFAVPNGATSIPTYAFYNCYNLKKVKIPMSVNSVGSYAFYSCYSLKELIFEGNITRIDANAFYRCMSIGLYDFRNCSSVPTLSATSAFTNIGNDAVILVSDDLYDNWVEATNWNTYASYIVKESEYNG